MQQVVQAGKKRSLALQYTSYDSPKNERKYAWKLHITLGPHGFVMFLYLKKRGIRVELSPPCDEKPSTLLR